MHVCKVNCENSTTFFISLLNFRYLFIQNSISLYKGECVAVIRVILEILASQSKTLAALGNLVRENGAYVYVAGQDVPSYDGQFKPRVANMVAEALSRSNQLSARLQNLTEDLHRRAERFRLVDTATQSGFLNRFGLHVNSEPGSFFLSLWKKLAQLIQPIFRLGDLLHQDKPLDMVVLQPSESGFGALIAEKKTSGFGALLEKMEKEKQEKLRQEAESLRLNGWPVPARNQLTPEITGAWSNVACTFTSLTMIMEYYHQVNTNNQFVTELDLMKLRDPEDGDSHKKISITALQDEMEELGYRYESVTGNNTLESLQEALTTGPVVVLVYLHGDTHAVVVRGIAPDGKILINDPWGGEQLKMEPEKFQKIWGSIEPDGNYMIVIRPNG